MPEARFSWSMSFLCSDSRTANLFLAVVPEGKNYLVIIYFRDKEIKCISRIFITPSLLSVDTNFTLPYWQVQQPVDTTYFVVELLGIVGIEVPSY